MALNPVKDDDPALLNPKAIMKWLGAVTQTVTIAAIIGGAGWAASMHSTVGEIKAELRESNGIHRLTIEHHGEMLTHYTKSTNHRLDRIERILDTIVKPYTP